MLAPEQIAVDKLSSPSPNEAGEIGVTNNEGSPTTEQRLPNGETEVGKNEDELEAMAESGPEADAKTDDEVQNAINEQELKYWSAVKENPNDFTSWTYLLQFVEQEVGKRNSFLQTKILAEFFSQIYIIGFVASPFQEEIHLSTCSEF